MSQPAQLLEFKKQTDVHYTCLCLSNAGMNKYAEEIKDNPKVNFNGVYQVGERDSMGQRQAFSELKISDVTNALEKDGEFSNLIASSLIVLIYSLWDEFYRKKIAEELGVDTNLVMSDVMGDIRVIRNCIVHKKSMVSNEHNKIKVLSWPNKSGALNINYEMFTELKIEINKMHIQIKDAT